MSEKSLHPASFDERLSWWKPLTVVRDPVGLGRELAVAAWFERRRAEGVVAIWVTAGADEGQAGGFEQRLSESLRIGAVTQSSDPGAGAHQGLYELEAALSGGGAGPGFVLVVSRFQHVRDERVLRGLLRLLVQHGNFRIIACSEGVHPLELLAERAVEVEVLEPDVSPGRELADAAKAIGVLLDPSWAERLGEAVTEWTSALERLASREEPASGHRARVAWTDELGDDSLARHLMVLLVAGPSNWRQLRDLWGDADPRQLLAAMESSGLVERIGGPEEIIFHVSPTVRSLVSAWCQSREPDALAELPGVLADWLSAQVELAGGVSEFQRAAASGDLEHLDYLWARSLAQMLRDDSELVSKALDALPPAALAARPAMKIIRDTLRVASTDTDDRRKTARAFADACDRLIRRRWESLSLNELLIVATGYLVHLRLIGQFQDSAAFADRVNARVSALASAQFVAGDRLAWFHLQRGLGYSLLLDRINAVRSYRQAFEYAMVAGIDSIQSHAAANIALNYAVEGDAARARLWLSRHRSYDTSDWPGDRVVRAGGYLAAGLLALDRLDIAAARAELDRLGAEPTWLELWPYVVHLHAQIGLLSGAAPEELAFIDEVMGACDPELSNKGAAAALVARARADLFIASGQGERAKRLLIAQDNARAFARVPAARLRLLAGSALNVAAAIDPLTWDPATPIRDRLEMLLIGAVGALRYDDARNAPRLINQALEIYETSGILRPFVTVASGELAQLLALAERRLDPADASLLAAHPPVYPDRLEIVELSERELAVLAALERTGSRQEIADSLFVSVNTVKSQLASIYQKIGSKSRAETLAKARKHGFLP